MRGKGIKSGYIFTAKHPFKSHFLKELIKYHGEVVHLICRSAIRPVIKAALNQAPQEYELEFIDSRPVKKSTFEFRFETANRQVAGSIKRLLGRHPSGVKLVDYKPEEIFDPDAKGAEGYAPLHPYVFKGEGIIVGEVEGVLKVYDKLKSNEFINCEEIDIYN
jgi:hypothetical protein